MDRALYNETNWIPDFGYYILPSKIYRNEWLKLKIKENSNFPIILKLHGSTNWLTSYLQPSAGKLSSMQETPPEDFYVYESTINPNSTYDGRYMAGYSDFSYGYYPPNLPLKGQKPPDGKILVMTTITEKGFPKGTAPSHGLFSMPLIIPPVKNKDYEHFGKLFSQLWQKAEDSLIKADKIIIIGYSFPITDIQTDIMFKTAFSKRISMPRIVIVDPVPENIVNRFIYSYRIKSDFITTHETYFDENFDVTELFQ